MIIKTARTLIITVLATVALAGSVHVASNANLLNPASFLVLGSCAGQGGNC